MQDFFKDIHSNYNDYLNDFLSEKALKYLDTNNLDLKINPQFLYDTDQFFREGVLDDYLELVKEDLEFEINKALPKSINK